MACATGCRIACRTGCLMAYVYITGMAYMVTAYVVMGYIGTAQDAYLYTSLGIQLWPSRVTVYIVTALYSYGIYRYGLHSYGTL